MHVLVIEDNPTNLELVIYLLRAFGHRTISVSDGEAGVAMAMEHRPDLILCDIAMPGLDGFGVASRLKSDPRTRDIPLIAVTASAMVGDRDKVISSGFDGYIRKPIDPETFVTEIESFLGK
jgi:CheY-like chemotaxis protein